MSILLSDEQRMFQDMFRDFASSEVAPLAEELDRSERPPVPTLHKAAGLDLLGIALPEQYGGMNAGALAYGLLMEEMGKVCLSTAVALNAHCTAATLIAACATGDQKQALLPLLARGEKLAAVAIAEPDAGSDLAAIATLATGDGDAIVINGRKSLVINGDVAGLLVVLAKDEASRLGAFVVEQRTPGLVFGWRDKQMGLRGASGCTIFFDQCRVAPAARLGGAETDAHAALQQAWGFSRLGLSFACLGIAERGLADSLEFARNRQQFGGPVARKQIIQGYLGDMATQIETLRCLAHATAESHDRGAATEREFAMLKLAAGQASTWVINKTVQIHGGMGYIKSFHVERLYRDVRAMTILDGTSETQRLTVAAEILKPVGVQISL